MNNLNEINKNENAIIRKLEDNYYIFIDGKCYKVNETGALVYKYIGSDMPISLFCQKMAKKYDSESSEMIMKDVMAFIEFLENINVLSG